MPDTDLPALLEQWSKTTSEATPGPWEIHTSSAIGIRLMSDEEDWPLAMDIRWRLDADFIATARAAMPLLLKAIDAVLKLHAPEPDRQWQEICPAHIAEIGTLRLSERPAAVAAIADCPDCRWTDDPKCKGCATHVTFTRWPCPTVQAITRELTGKETGDGA